MFLWWQKARKRKRANLRFRVGLYLLLKRIVCSLDENLCLDSGDRVWKRLLSHIKRFKILIDFRRVVIYQYLSQRQNKHLTVKQSDISLKAAVYQEPTTQPLLMVLSLLLLPSLHWRCLLTPTRPPPHPPGWYLTHGIDHLFRRHEKKDDISFSRYSLGQSQAQSSDSLEAWGRRTFSLSVWWY